ncbi:MAG TPA: radical SAM protein [Bryobacteraceae bacterium]|nr:radical SAM protein [Bryobacteraceae bacterium]
MQLPEARARLRAIFAKPAPLGDEDTYFLGQILFYVETCVIKTIRRRQASLSGLRTAGHGFLAAWGRGDLTPGCRACLEGSGLWALRASQRCNLSCDFCYYRGVQFPEMLPHHYKIANGGYITLDAMKVFLDKQGSGLEAVAWVSHEPCLSFEKHLAPIQYIHSKGIHQSLYTNGLLLTEDMLMALRDSGLEELRINLAASHCATPVLRILRIARKYVKYLCIESPMTHRFFLEFRAHQGEILDTGLDQINCAELHVRANNKDPFQSEPLYCYKYGYVSPISSRHATYDLIDAAEKEGWRDIVINDCSNEAKYYRGIRRGLGFGEIDYGPELELPQEWYLDALERYRICGLGVQAAAGRSS